MPGRGGVRFIFLRFWARGLFWAVLIPVFSWCRFGWRSLFNLVGEEETLSFLRLVPASVCFIIESVLPSSFPVDWQGANFALLRSCLKWSCTVFNHLDSDGLAALECNLIAFLVWDLECSTALNCSFNWASVCDLEWGADVLSFWVFCPVDLAVLFRSLHLKHRFYLEWWRCTTYR